MFGLILCVFSLSAHAGQTPAFNKPVIWTNGFYSGIKARLPASKYRFLDRATQRKDWLDEGYLQPGERDAVFKKLRLEKALAKMDELEKDILVMDARFSPIGDLRKWYPHLTAVQLRQLKRAVAEIK